MMFWSTSVSSKHKETILHKHTKLQRVVEEMGKKADDSKGNKTKQKKSKKEKKTPRTATTTMLSAFAAAFAIVRQMMRDGNDKMLSDVCVAYIQYTHVNYTEMLCTVTVVGDHSLHIFFCSSVPFTKRVIIDLCMHIPSIRTRLWNRTTKGGNQ